MTPYHLCQLLPVVLHAQFKLSLGVITCSSQLSPNHLLLCPPALQRIQEMATARIAAVAAGAPLDEASQLDLLDQTLNRVLVMRVDTPEALKANLNQLAQMVGPKKGSTCWHRLVLPL